MESHTSEYLAIRVSQREARALSTPALHHVLKLARTIIDLAGAKTIAAPHIAEALQYRPRVDVG